MLPGGRFVIFDGACGLCTWTMKRAAALDAAGRYRFVPFQYLSTADYARFGRSEAQCRNALTLWINGAIYSGTFAINRFLWSFWWCRPLILIVHVVFPLLIVEMLAYRAVARWRVPISAMLGTARYALVR